MQQKYTVHSEKKHETNFGKKEFILTFGSE